jgi:hypothetical protein
MTLSAPSRSVLVQVVAPALTVAPGWVKVEGLWAEPKPVAVRWVARCAGKPRWGPVVGAQRLIWRDKVV